MSKFADARLKINRANHHIGHIKQRIGDLENSYTAVIDVEPKGSQKAIKYDLADKAAIQDISLMIGDTLHNLKCALDYAWIATLERHGYFVHPKAQFPAHETRDALESALTDLKKGFRTELIKLVLTKIKPYPGGNDALWTVKELNISDKHRLLLPLIGYTTIVGLEMEDEGGKPVRRIAGVTTQPPPWYIRIPDGHYVKNKGKPALDVLFGEETPVSHCNASTLLEHYSVIVLEVIKTLEAFI